MLSYLLSARDQFWEERHWFPPGITWNNLNDTALEKFPHFEDLTWPVLGYAGIILAIRMVFEWSFARPLGRYFGIKNTTSELPNIFYRIVHFFSKLYNSYDAGAMNGKMAYRRRRSLKLIPKSTLDKFAECCWRFAFYLFIFSFGLYTIWNTPYFRNTSHCWLGYPLQPMDRKVHWHYKIEMSFYVTLIVSQFVDVQRKDFWVNFIHHIATVLVLLFSYTDNLVRMGGLILVTHDAADFWMEAAKMARYCKKTVLCNVLFGIFTVVWIATRCFYLPFWLLYSALVETVVIIGFHEVYYLVNSLLILLQILHIIWTILIVRILISALKSGEADDERSDSEECSEKTLDNHKAD